ncbi:SH3-like domain-containing protein [Actinomycetospora straminea]|uniref:Thiocyanate hydrolase subunit beta n=1 Tax=Actinomycetospora straminea TaxID=663607 RepID=A0ABP9EDZ4_9PSEU|nr:SH3-like domain-containing protein [Actinomycetospora straminea]MDD7934358.1 nitrile hydratase subunit beta [Actinomycetospora straminea]
MTTDHDISSVRVRALEQIVERGQTWDRMAARYHVTHPLPPWKSRLDATCDALDDEGAALPLLTRRDDEDRMSREVYASLPYPENQLVALAHSLVTRNVVDEDELAARMAAVRARLDAAGA